MSGPWGLIRQKTQIMMCTPEWKGYNKLDTKLREMPLVSGTLKTGSIISVVGKSTMEIMEPF